MKAVSRFEYNLLRILSFFLGRLPLEQVRLVVHHRWEKEAPKCLSRDCVELAKDALGKGCVEFLARAGGWRRRRFLRRDRVADGRLWQRTPSAELGLVFSPHTLGFLRWLTLSKPTDGRTAAWTPPPEELTVGDRLLLYLAVRALHGTEVGDALALLPAIMQHGLCRLAYPELFTAAERDYPEPDYLPWTTGVGACILEALQEELAARCLETERNKAQVSDWQQMRRLGRSQEQALGGLLRAAEAAERPDLCRFLLTAAAELLGGDTSPRFWVGGLQSAGPRVSDRAETNQAALALVRQLERLYRWERAARGVRHFDDGYARSQLFLVDWEQCDGGNVYRRAVAVQQQLDPMRQAGQPQPEPA